MSTDEFRNALATLIEDAEKTVSLDDIGAELAGAAEQIEMRIQFPEAFEPPATCGREGGVDATQDSRLVLAS